VVVEFQRISLNPSISSSQPFLEIEPFKQGSAMWIDNEIISSEAILSEAILSEIKHNESKELIWNEMLQNEII